MAENSAAAVPPAKKGKLKLIILLVVVVILAIALSVAGTLWFLGGGLPGMGDDTKAEASVAEETFSPSVYLAIEKALVTTVQGEGRQRYAQAYVALEADDPQALTAAQLHLPLIRSQLVMVLGNSSFTELQTPEGRQNLAANMLVTVNEVLKQEGEPAVSKVLFRNFVVQ
ncbi:MULTISPECIES: flagellar basal body-associated FliL family protein [unclassified Marinobacter]|uniref:flagellar basal body-associated FliL family protein n=1 Tax=unclassified Marinobacter TaxID=83889 RepID=UPI0019089854|nr:flagellar basal body-associated FliL family protein [Marinobacter sp. 1-4A]MBK1850172.1 flagellar basal body-associated FliL family protein [Marinobacter sp. 1-4A]